MEKNKQICARVSGRKKWHNGNPIKVRSHTVEKMSREDHSRRGQLSRQISSLLTEECGSKRHEGT